MRCNDDGAMTGLTGLNVRVHHINKTDRVLAYHRWAKVRGTSVGGVDGVAKHDGMALIGLHACLLACLHACLLALGRTW